MTLEQAAAWAVSACPFEARARGEAAPGGPARDGAAAVASEGWDGGVPYAAVTPTRAAGGRGTRLDYADIDDAYCERCHGDPRLETGHFVDGASVGDEWRRSAMSAPPAWTRGAADPRRCASCHGAVVRGDASSLSSPRRDAAMRCGTCHDPSAAAPFGLRVYDTAARDHRAGGARAFDRMGQGALCATCHQRGAAEVSSALAFAEATPHAPQADVLFGRGSALLGDGAPGAHRYIADTCARCHMTRPAPRDPAFGRVGGHTFSTSLGGTVHEAACAPCHGPGDPARLGARDWDGDGRARPLAVEHTEALAALAQRLDAEVARAGVRDSCVPARRARGVAVAPERTGSRRLLLRHADGWLGDCDGDGVFGGGETPVGAARLPERLRAAAHDLALLRADGSAGVHNPGYTSAVLRALDATLRD